MKAKRYLSIVPFVIISILLAPFLFIPKDQSLLFINGLNTPLGDVFFKNLTWFGEGFMVSCCAIVLLFVRVRWFFIFLIGLVIHVLLIQINKQYLFNDIYRPSVYMSWICKDQLLHFVDGIRIRREVSFPSGHTTGAAFAASFIALLVNSKKASIWLAILAIAVGISRVYLAQHFVIDIYFGFLFGTISSVLGYSIVQQMDTKFLWMNNYLISIKSRKLKLRLGFLKHTFYKGLRSSPKY